MGTIILKIKFHIFAIIKILLYKLLYRGAFQIGKETTFRKNFSLYLERGAKIEIGRDCFFNNGCSLNVLKKIKIGDGCIFGENVKIYDHNHRFADSDKKIKEQGYSVSELNIGKHCWFGSNVVILKGANIGDNCVIGAGCIISGKIESNTLVKPKQDYIMEEIRRVR